MVLVGRRRYKSACQFWGSCYKNETVINKNIFKGAAVLSSESANLLEGECSLKSDNVNFEVLSSRFMPCEKRV